MEIHYCDTCGCPIKGTKYVLITMVYRENPSTVDDYGNYGYQKGFMKEKEQEICEQCHTILNQIFEYRHMNSLRLSEDCSSIYRLPEKSDEKAKKTKKDKDSKS